MSIPYLAIGNEELKDLPRVKAGDELSCPKCNGRHILEAGKNQDGTESDLILFYHCGETLYVGAVSGRLIAHSKVGSGGTI